GHIIFPRLSRVGDGIVTAAAVLRVARSKEIAFSDLAGDFRPFPQILLNIEVREKLPFDRVPEISAAVQEVEDVLSGKGRVLLRYSGTENLARVMIEAEEGELAEQNARWLADVIKKNLGKEIDQ
ncbi:MAG: phosphoglucosamine mutase, partial [Blastocatellia bacterium]